MRNNKNKHSGGVSCSHLNLFSSDCWCKAMPLIFISFSNNHFDCISPVDEKSVLCENLSFCSLNIIRILCHYWDRLKSMHELGGNSNFPTCAVNVDGADQLPHREKRLSTELIENRIVAITKVPFTVMAQLKAIILGRQPLYTVPAPSTAQVGILVPTPAMDRLLDWFLYLFSQYLLILQVTKK